MAVVLKLLAVRVRQSREAPHVHSHRQVAALDMGRAHHVTVGLAGDLVLAGTDALRRAVPLTAAPITSAGRSSPLGPCGI